MTSGHQTSVTISVLANIGRECADTDVDIKAAAQRSNKA